MICCKFELINQSYNSIFIYDNILSPHFTLEIYPPQRIYIALKFVYTSQKKSGCFAPHSSKSL